VPAEHHTPSDLLDDLAAETEHLEHLLAALPHETWAAPSAAARWSITDQVVHLTGSDAAGLLAATDPDSFAATSTDLLRQITSDARSNPATNTPEVVLARWVRTAAQLRQALLDLPAGHRLPWFGPSMSVPSFATARLMETWAHGLDISMAVGVPPSNTDRLAHVCHLGAITRGWSFTVRGAEPPTAPVRIDLTLPSGTSWSHGDPDVPDRVEGSAFDFCRVITQRINAADTDLRVAGPNADAWMDVAQCYAGRPSLPPVARAG